MRLFHLVVHEAGGRLREVDIRADDPYHAFQTALNERSSCEVELWEGDRLLVRMSKSDAQLWKLDSRAPDAVQGSPPASFGAATA
jgi:hypothetical protein